MEGGFEGDETQIFTVDFLFMIKVLKSCFMKNKFGKNMVSCSL